GAYGSSGFQYRLATTGDYQPSLRFPWLAAKEKSNFCELFEATMTPLQGSATGSDDALRKAAEDLFK
ncbi:MAG: hypothetical protein ABW068_16990, partial [Candidatus Thiodiazotropha sp.]